MFMTACGCNAHSVVNPLQIELEKKLTELGLSYRVYHNDLYTISNSNGCGKQSIFRWISSLPVNDQVNGSKNGHEIEAIGLFKFKFLASELEPDIFVFTFPNPIKNHAEFLIIPTDELMSRLFLKCQRSGLPKSVELVFWLMADGFVYDTTNISVEGEWYFISKGVNGRMATGSELDYSEYLNNWQRLIV